LPGGVNKLVEIDGLADVAIGAQAVSGNAVLLFVGRSENDHGQQIGPWIGAQATKNFETVNFRQFEIEQNDLGHNTKVAPGVGAFGEQIIESFDAVAGDDYFVQDIAFAQSAEHELFVIGVVFYQQNDSCSPFGSIKISPV